jgi:hypothetical protein
MYGPSLHSLLSCRFESCTSHPCLGPAVESLLGRDVSRAPAASPGARAQHVRLWQYGHARHERHRGTFVIITSPIPLRDRPSLPHSSLTAMHLSAVLLLPSPSGQRPTSTGWLRGSRVCGALALAAAAAAPAAVLWGGGRRGSPSPIPVVRLRPCSTFNVCVCVCVCVCLCRFANRPLNVWLTRSPTSPADDRRPRHDGSPR